MPLLLVVAHCPSPNTRTLMDAVMAGARHPDLGAIDVVGLSPFDTGPEQVMQADAVILGTTENFGYMNGALKDFFERIYYPCLEHTEALPYALFVKGGLDGTGARRSVERIVSGLKWRAVQPAVVMTGDYQPAWLEDMRTLGMTVAAGLEAGIY